VQRMGAPQRHPVPGNQVEAGQGGAWPGPAGNSTARPRRPPGRWSATALAVASAPPHPRPSSPRRRRLQPAASERRAPGQVSVTPPTPPALLRGQHDERGWVCGHDLGRESSPHTHAVDEFFVIHGRPPGPEVDSVCSRPRVAGPDADSMRRARHLAVTAGREDPAHHQAMATDGRTPGQVGTWVASTRARPAAERVLLRTRPPPASGQAAPSGREGDELTSSHPNV
jgi:hypothetical protein